MRSSLKILEPCNQNWSKMTDFDKGKFCGKCQKEVIDFTSYSKEEIYKKLNNSNGVCGRLDLSQLKEEKLIKTKLENNFTKLTLIVGLGSILGITEPALAKSSETKTELIEKKDWKSIIPKKVLNDSIILKGKVLDQDNLPVPGTNVILKGTKIGVQTDYDGLFSIAIPEDKLSSENYLTFAFIGFKTYNYKFYRANKYLKINLEPDTSFMGEVIIVRRTNIFDKIGYFFKNIFSRKKTCN